MVDKITIEELLNRAKSQESIHQEQEQEPIVEPEESLLEEALRPKSRYSVLEFENAAEMFLFKEMSQKGTRRPHKWQAEIHHFLGRKDLFSIASPLRLYLQTCNGSGKDSYITAPFAVWVAACNIRSRFICTSSSNTQLELQTESYIRTECEAWNNLVGDKMFLIKKHHIVCTYTGSEIVLFSTNEPGRAEGWHPFPDAPEDSIMVIAINEAKTIPEDIFEHLKKCTGYRYWLEISSPGSSSGHFYNNAIKCRSFEDIYSEGDFSSYTGEKIRKKVTAYECPHISQREIKDAIEENGETDPWIQNTYLAEFTSVTTEIIISAESVRKSMEDSIKKIEESEELPKRVGIDLGIGGDESTMYCFVGNSLFKSKEFRAKDTTYQRDIINKTLTDWGFDKDSDNIFIDDGNIGHSVADMLIEMGWNIQRVLNQSKANNTKKFGNRGAEIWWNFRTLLEHGVIKFPSNLDRVNSKLFTQLTSRYFKQRDILGGLILESKAEARSHGRPSPDRADAVVLANCRIRWRDVKEEEENVPEEKPKYSLENLKEVYDRKFVYKDFDRSQVKHSLPRGSLQCLLKRKS